MPPILTSDASISELIDAIKAAPRLLGGPGCLVAKTVAVKSNRQWYNHVTVVALIPSGNRPATVDPIDLGLVQLIQRSLIIDDSFDLDALTLLVTGWRGAVGAETGYSLQETVHARRFYSDPVTDKFPGWEIQLHELVPDRPSFSLPDGPFLAPDRDVFAPDLPTLAGRWLEMPQWKDRNVLAHEYRVILEDRRACITTLVAKDAQLSVGLRTITEEPLYCGASITTFAGKEFHYVVQVADGRADFKFDSAVQRIDIWLMIQDGDALDRYSESPQRASWGRDRSIYNRPPELANPKLATLKAALLSGEGQGIEFKPFIRLRPRDAKSREVLVCGSAFANAGGGHLFMGVTDYGEPVGISAQLQKSYGNRCKNDMGCLRDAYVHDLKLLFSEGLNPPVEVVFDWFDIALTGVLRIHIRSSSGIPTYLIESGDIFTRVGATNRKVRPSRCHLTNNSSTIVA